MIFFLEIDPSLGHISEVVAQRDGDAAPAAIAHICNEAHTHVALSTIAHICKLAPRSPRI